MRRRHAWKLRSVRRTKGGAATVTTSANRRVGEDVPTSVILVCLRTKRKATSLIHRVGS